MKPLCVDLYCGLGGWADGFLAEGYDVIGFDIERHDYGTGGYPAQLVLQDVLTLHGSQFKDAAVIVASPPCQAYSYMAMPWRRAKKMAAEIRNDYLRYSQLNTLFVECFRIQWEASEAAGRHIPLIVENVKGANDWVHTPARAAYGSFLLWGDIEQVGRQIRKPGSMHDKFASNDFLFAPFHGQKNSGGSWFNVANNTTSGLANNPVSVPSRKHGGDCFNDPSWPGKQGGSMKTSNLIQMRDGHRSTKHLTNQTEHVVGRKQEGSGAIWFDTGIAKHGSRSNARKAASAQIAKIPFPLARYIAATFRPM